MTEKEYKNRFDKLFQLLTRAHLCFYVWKGLQNKDYQTQFNRYKNFFGATMFALEEAWLQSLANIYEYSSYSKKDEIISVYSLIENQKDIERKNKAEILISENKTILNSFSVLRNNQLSHYNADHLSNPSEKLRKFPIKYGDVEKLLGATEELLHCLHPDNNHSFAMEGFNKGAEKDSMLIMKAIDYYLKQEKIHYDKLKEGNEFIQFPPSENFK